MKLTIVEKKNFLSGTAMHIDFVMCNNINCTKCRVSFLYEMSDFVFVRNVWFRFCTKCLVLVFVRDVVCTKCRVYELSCPRCQQLLL